ncbi:UNKNOWN [Stylonychia lemnae]|uniref:Uncharacterized protein n=1 Tax=Stylonychia lemnae TaxID=5949 RepID=A0A078BA55_STYLE|nr:UNKNOWN [Stylonychia lemnae]|eukprot:CDW91385.1 UNKNOWN [Stylonychia lemnae]
MLSKKRESEVQQPLILGLRDFESLTNKQKQVNTKEERNKGTLTIEQKEIYQSIDNQSYYPLPKEYQWILEDYNEVDYSKIDGRINSKCLPLRFEEEVDDEEKVVDQEENESQKEEVEKEKNIKYEQVADVKKQEVKALSRIFLW